MNILIVDDQEISLDIARLLLMGDTRTITCVMSGAKAVEAVATGNFDVVLMDVRMAGMDGLEATRLIRTLPPPRGQVPIIGLTAQAFEEQVKACFQAGMNDHLSKPYDPADLLAIVLRTARREG